MPGPRRTRRPLVALIVLLVILGVGYAVQAFQHDDHSPPHSTPSTSAAVSSPAVSSTAVSSSAAATGVALSSLPTQARATVTLIKAGGPYPYSQDGVVFRNAERHLPNRALGYYHEYTVTTPGENDRGARRIITGNAGEFYYTADHYDSFVRVDVNR